MLRPTATPHPNQIAPEDADEWIASLPPHDESLQPALIALRLAFGVCDCLIGVEQANINFLPYAPFIKGNNTESKIKAIRILLLEAMIGQEIKISEITNPLIKFHLKNHETPLYPILAARLHIGIVGRYMQVYRQGEYLKKISSVVSPLNIILPHLTPDNLTNPDDPIITEKEVADVLRQIPKQRIDAGGRVHYAYSTISTYKGYFLDTLYNSFSNKIYRQGYGGSRKKLAQCTPRDSFMPDSLPLNHPSRDGYGERAWVQYIAETEDEDSKKAKRLKKQSAHPRGLSQSYLDPYRTPANADRLSLHALALIEEIIQLPEFIENPLNRLAFQIPYHFMLHLRRPSDFSATIQIGVPRSSVKDGPVLDTAASLIHKIPLFYFGKPATLVNNFGIEYFLKSENNFANWDSEFEGYTHSSPVSAIPLPRLILNEIIEYRQLLPELPNRLLSRQNQHNHLLPFDTAWFNQKLKILTKLLQTRKTGHRRITQTLIKNSFDAYYLGRLNCVDYWHISERAKYAIEMPVRYTGLTISELAEHYYPIHNAFLDEIEQVADNPLDLPRSAPKTVRKFPEIQLGSWHALELEVINALAAFFHGPDARQLVPPGLTRSQKLYNLRVYETAFGLGCLNGLRDFELPRLEINDYCPETQSLVVRGRGGRMRELPLHPTLCERIKRLLRARRQTKSTQLLWLYGKTGQQVRLSTKKVNQFFAEACKILGWEALDFYSLRHRFRSELVRLGIPDAIINYLMGHGKNYIGNFSQNSLDDAVWQAYLPAAEQLIEKFGIQEKNRNAL